MSQAGYTLQQIAALLSGAIKGDPAYKVEGISTLQAATEKQISFLSNPKYRKHLESTRAGAVILPPEFGEFFSGNAVILDDPYLGYAKLSRYFERNSTASSGIHPSAVVDATAHISADATIESGVVIGANTEIHAGAVIKANSVIGRACCVGENTLIHPNVTFYDDVYIGTDAVVHSGAVIGADGFGFANDKGRWVKIAQLGGVRIGNNVEIGACTTIDRGALDNTIISDGVILDNQIQIAHNVVIGKNTAIAGCTAVAGSTKIGDRCSIAGACGITGHLDITDDVHVTAMTLVTKSIDKAGTYSSGTGMLPHKQWQKNVVRFRQLDTISRRLRSIEAKISEE
ncbi:MAG: UDP-3-O-(3-hydroxymyristoyl)glucosamine N-acyltransferase [Neptuniibacter caesariensis]|uniref:UDP-3-O-acylglucosamine N-acyltransferase n=1 Tax=Neptuniibacter caesariensis TaxID=207954 RepID=A0A2G6JNG1_NEPCE|nr:MAG: UDP-3-O-(3-hydroxymyristoyl)glucosamine N-acyltransferase [Neptuniibacter caesariensis]